MSTQLEERRRYSLTPPLKIVLLLSLVPLAAAAYYLFVPWMLQTQTGYIRCGSVWAPPSGEFERNVCNDAVDVHRIRFWTLLGLGLALPIASALLHGFTSRSEFRESAPDVPEDDPHDEPVRPRRVRDDVWDDESDVQVERRRDALPDDPAPHDEELPSRSSAYVAPAPEPRREGRRDGVRGVFGRRRDDDLDLTVDRPVDDDPDDGDDWDAREDVDTRGRRRRTGSDDRLDDEDRHDTRSARRRSRFERADVDDRGDDDWTTG